MSETASARNDRLPFGERELIAVTGAGGKTSLVLRLASLFPHSLLTTTTHMGRREIPPSMPLLVGDAVSLRGDLSPCLAGGSVAAARGVEGEKLKGFEAREVDGLYASGLAKKLIVEADGARGFPVKGYGENEPVIPALTTCQIVVVGSELFTDPLDGRSVFRLPLFLAASGLEEGARPTAEELARILESGRLFLKGSPEGGACRRYLVINKADRLSREGLALVAETVARLGRYDRIYLMTLGGSRDGWAGSGGGAVAEDGAGQAFSPLRQWIGPLDRPRPFPRHSF